MTSIYEDDANVGTLTKAAIEVTDSRLLQIHRFSEMDSLHTKILMEVFDPETNAQIADVGCGVGELAELMSIQRPDLSFILVNPSQAQLEVCPQGFRMLQGSAEDTHLNTGLTDAVMYSYVLGHIDIPLALKECARVLKPDGKIYVYDIFKTDDSCRLGEDLDYNIRAIDETISLFADEGFKFSHSRTTKFALPKVGVLMPYKDTLKNTISAAMVFTR